VAFHLALAELALHHHHLQEDALAFFHEALSPAAAAHCRTGSCQFHQQLHDPCC